MLWRIFLRKKAISQYLDIWLNQTRLTRKNQSEVFLLLIQNFDKTDQRPRLDIDKNGGGIMLVTELMKSTNYKNGNTSKEKYPDPKKYRRAV